MMDGADSRPTPSGNYHCNPKSYRLVRANPGEFTALPDPITTIGGRVSMLSGGFSFQATGRCRGTAVGARVRYCGGPHTGRGIWTE